MRALTLLVLLVGAPLLFLASCRKGEEGTQAGEGQPAADAGAAKAQPEQPAEEESGETSEESQHGGAEEPESAPPPVEHADAEYSAGTVGDVQLVRVFADSFPALDARKRVLAYHLSRAVLAGRDIAFDQVHRDGVEVRRLIEGILAHSLQPDPNIEAKLTAYLKLLWIHGGFYDRFSGRKILPQFSAADLEKTSKAANAAGADLDLDKSEPLEGKLSRLHRVIFDASFQPQLVAPWPTPDEDWLGSSALNLYSGVSLKVLASFKENYPRNSRLSRIDEELVEEIYRAGDQRRKVAPGRYARELRQTIRRLNDALPVAERPQREIFTNLIEYFRTGEPSAFEDAIRAWTATALPVEFALGFLDTSLDPRGMKGVFAGLVGILDGPNTSRMNSLLRQVQYFEERMPWGPEFRKHWDVPPLAVAVHLLVTGGRAGPVGDFAFRIRPDKTLPEEVFRKVLLFPNVIESHLRAVDLPLAREFVAPASREAVQKGLGEFALLRVALREVLGRALGKEDRSAAQLLRGVAETVEALKAELSSLWLIQDQKLPELGLLSGKDTGKAALDFAVAEAVLAQALQRGEVQRPTLLANRIIIRYLVEKAKVVSLVQEKDGKIYPMVVDPEGLRGALSTLLVRAEKILATGNRASALRLLKNYGGPANWPGLDSMAQRARAAGLRRLVAYVMPRLISHRGESGKVEDVTLSQDETFDRQIMRYRRY